ncbi:polysaccharide deacetylase family protein [Aureispira anguillae]|uniref:Polysaccharide deacetylase family protein n=1 Tax=Aureispira anguillae TaxID=2864201 RepID=A0A915YF07_9BACT|nr:polysaccharide deacetylase family protein [Aureispira anguillae]BDS11791.1 polysaccharide deacetylase family protein [Aureispira anguillae]
MLKQALIQSLHTFSSFIPLSWLQRLSRQSLFSLFYHTVSDQDLPHIKHLYKVRNSQLFEADLDFLLQHFSPISLEQLIDHVQNGKTLPPNAFLLTFDDGLAECYHLIAPLLKQKGIPATFFLNSDFVDNKALMFRYKASYLIEQLKTRSNATKIAAQYFEQYQLPFDSLKKSLLAVRWPEQALLDDLAVAFDIDFEAFLQEQKPYLTQEQIRAMLKDGFTFGSHSQNHPTYNKLNLNDQIQQTIRCQHYLDLHFDLPYKTFAFPFTDYGVSAAFFHQILGKENFQLTFGGAGLKQEQIKGQLQRFGMETQALTSAKRLIHTEYSYYIIKSIFKKNTIHRN